MVKPSSGSLGYVSMHAGSHGVVAAGYRNARVRDRHSRPDEFDLICTDPPYYDAIPYSDLMDFFHVWLRRVLHGHCGLKPTLRSSEPLGPKWNSDENVMAS